MLCLSIFETFVTFHGFIKKFEQMVDEPKTKKFVMYVYMFKSYKQTFLYFICIKHFHSVLCPRTKALIATAPDASP